MKNIYSIPLSRIIEHFFYSSERKHSISGNNNSNNNSNNILIYNNNKKLQMYLYVFGKKEKEDYDNFITTSICFLLYSKLSCYG